MVEQKNKQIKIYIVIALAIIFVINGYFRLIHARIKQRGSPTSPKPSLASIDIPKIQTKLQKTVKQTDSDRLIVLHSVIRDIFKEPVMPAPEKPEPTEEIEKTPEPPPPMTLKGTIVGGKRPIAIINGRFLRTGDMMGDYQVVEITKDIVKLSSGNNEIVLEVLKYVSK